MTRSVHFDGDHCASVSLAAALAVLLASAGGCAAHGPEVRKLSTASGSGEAAPPVAVCVEFQPEVRFRNLGYDHIVHLRSRCDRRTICAVATDVNPTAVDVAVPPHERVSVLTFRGSPAREFTANVTCRFAP